MRARDVMSSPVHTARVDTAAEAAASLMGERSVTALPVLDGAGRLVGMVSEGDLLRDRVPPDPTARLRRPAEPGGLHRPGVVGEVMSPHPVTTRPGADLAEVAETMLRHDVRSLPVVDDGAVVGIVSRRDILRAMVRSDEMLTREVQHRLDEYAGGRHRWTAGVTGGVAHVHGPVGEADRAAVTVLARTVPGVAAVRLDGAEADAVPGRDHA